MKKLTAWALLLAMCVAMFAGCSNNNTPAATEPAAKTAEDFLSDAARLIPVK